ncbi:MAG: ATPase RavA [Lentisphaerae bacterium ADurb.BinA184]|nr:MAG: ATPase RavA [Lentisphaerae bacterium ADurb.BinA184]
MSDGELIVDRREFEELGAKVCRVREEVGKVIVGQREVMDRLLMGIFSGGHCLMMGVPGLAKTLMVSTLSQVLDLKFKRIQFTPDLMPSDITGSEILESRADGSKAFRFVEGPLFANMILADEINRTPPKTQAALLEAMQEHRITVGNKTYRLAEPFFVLATQNPIEQEGTYPLPEAQQDRFMFFLWVDYPEEDEEVDILNRTTANRTVEIQPVLNGADILKLIRIVREIPISQPLVQYVTRLVRCSRNRRGQEGDGAVPDFVRKYLQWGAGPRAGQYLILGAKARAFLHGHTHVAAEDIRAVAHPVLSHRIIVNFAAEADGITPAGMIDRILETVKE